MSQFALSGRTGADRRADSSFFPGPSPPGFPALTLQPRWSIPLSSLSGSWKVFRPHQPNVREPVMPATTRTSPRPPRRRTRFLLILLRALAAWAA